MAAEKVLEIALLFESDNFLQLCRISEDMRAETEAAKVRSLRSLDDDAHQYRLQQARDFATFDFCNDCLSALWEA